MWCTELTKLDHALHVQVQWFYRIMNQWIKFLLGKLYSDPMSIDIDAKNNTPRQKMVYGKANGNVMAVVD